MATTFDTDRVTIRLNGELRGIFEEIMRETPAKTPTDVVKRALLVYHDLCRAHVNGADLKKIYPGEDGQTSAKRIFL